MPGTSMWDAIGEHIAAATGTSFKLQGQRPVGGGCINEAYRLRGAEQEYFVKLNRADGLAMFEAEAQGLSEMAATDTIRVPLPVCSGVAGGRAFLVLEHLDLSGRPDAALLGQQLAALHRVQRPRHGWDRDNTIGSTPQLNTESDDWLEFWREQRLGFQLQLADRQGYGGALQRKGRAVSAALDALLADHRPPASLLHGDLWGGNCAGDAAGRPVIYDPAVYYGDRETDLAMTELFGGFGAAFMTAYNDAYPLESGYETRKTLYNLYHILNHLNLFGGGYGSQAEAMMDRLLDSLH